MASIAELIQHAETQENVARTDRQAQLQREREQEHKRLSKALSTFMKDLLNVDVSEATVRFTPTYSDSHKGTAFVDVEGLRFVVRSAEYTTSKLKLEVEILCRTGGHHEYYAWNPRESGYAPVESNYQSIPQRLLEITRRIERWTRECTACTKAGIRHTRADDLRTALEHGNRAQYDAALNVLINEASDAALKNALSAALNTLEIGWHAV